MSFLVAALALLIIGALISLIAGKHHRIALTAALTAIIVASLLTATTALRVLLNQETLIANFTWLVPGGAFALQVDPLTGFFLLPVTILPPLAAIYAVAYLDEDSKRRNLGAHFSLYCLLVAALTLVVTAANALLFIAAWEIMTISSFFLVSYDHHHAEVRQAAWLYLLVAHFGLLLILAFFLLAGSHCGSLNFADFTPLTQAGPTLTAILFSLALVGFGIKAGLFPFYIWLPDAHPAAPSHVSAVMSGVVVKTGIYGILRVMTWLPPLSALWGAIILALGLLGALYGIAMAMVQKDLKRCLAYSTVENIGIIFMGIGLGVLATAQQLPVVAALAFAGALLHLWNHTLFKGLLFLGAGTLLHATGTRNLDQMGGLLRRMPQAGLLIIGGSVALAALPPLNGFVSEWLIYLGLLHAGVAMSGVSALGMSMVLALFGVVGTLAVVTFTRLIGIALLGEARSPAAARAYDASTTMLWPMRLLLFGCLIIGLLPQLTLHLLSPVLSQLTPTAAPELVATFSQLGQIGLWGVILCAALIMVALLLVALQRRRPTTIAATWGCAFPRPTAQMAYTAESFSGLAHHHLLPQTLQPEVSKKRPRTLFPATVEFFQHSQEVILQRGYQPLFSYLAERCVQLRWLQQGKQHLYLLYIFICCAGLMLWSILASKGL
ncbi:MAG: proton-conducting transporter membrane subunit [Desulfuromonadales bacterium]|nr:proton-conducting transporter membrane subunit [Desulfuromonadales bacterium]